MTRLRSKADRQGAKCLIHKAFSMRRGLLIGGAIGYPVNTPGNPAEGGMHALARLLWACPGLASRACAVGVRAWAQRKGRGAVRQLDPWGGRLSAGGGRAKKGTPPISPK